MKKAMLLNLLRLKLKLWAYGICANLCYNPNFPLFWTIAASQRFPSWHIFHSSSDKMQRVDVPSFPACILIAEIMPTQADDKQTTLYLSQMQQPSAWIILIMWGKWSNIFAIYYFYITVCSVPRSLPKAERECFKYNYFALIQFGVNVFTYGSLNK